MRARSSQNLVLCGVGRHSRPMSCAAKANKAQSPFSQALLLLLPQGEQKKWLIWEEENKENLKGGRGDLRHLG